VIDATEIVVVDDGVFALEGFGARRQPSRPAAPNSLFARGEGAVGKPPEQTDA